MTESAPKANIDPQKLRGDIWYFAALTLVVATNQSLILRTI